MVLGRSASTPSWRCIFGTRLIGASTVAAAGHFATVGSCSSHVSHASLGCAAIWTAFLLAATLVMVGLNAWRRQREQTLRDIGTAQTELSADDKQEVHVHGPQTGAAADLGGDENEPETQVYNPPPLVDQASGIISPFAAFMPLFDDEEEPREAHAAAEPASPSTPACHRATDFTPAKANAGAAAGAVATMPRVSADIVDVPSQPAALTPALSEPARPQRTSLEDDERQQSRQYAASLASMLPSSPLNTINAATTPAAAGSTIASRAGSLLPSRSSIASSLSSLGSWVSSLLARVASAPPAVKHHNREEDAAVVQGRSPARASKDRQSLDSEGLPHTPLPLRKRGSVPSFPSAPSGGSTASLGSLLDIIQPAVLASGGDEEQRSSLKGLSRPASTLEMSAAVGALEFSDWEVSPAEIEICKRPDGSAWELGSGGFGKVYKALRYGVQAVAVKVLLGASSEARDASLAEFQNEIAILRACKDPNIVTFLGACLQEEATMLITEYCEGGSLDRNIKRGKVNWYKRGKKVALDVAKGLVFLHSRRIVHFDLKSANILLKLDGTAKIADVGLSKVIGREMSAVTGHLGTLAWAAPEMLLGARCTSKADIYSFGVLLWEICTGETPMRGQMRDVRPPTECPYEVRELILSCLDPSPRARPSALQLVERLQAISSSPPPTAAMTPPASPLQPALPSRTPGGSPGPATAAAALAAAVSSPAGPVARSPARVLGLPLGPVRVPAVAMPVPAATAPAALALSAAVHRGRPASLDANVPSPARPSPAAAAHAATAGEEAVSFVGLPMPGSPFDSMTPGQEDPIAWGGMPEGRSAFGACPAYPAAFQMQEQRGLQLQGQQGSRVVASQQAGVSLSQPALSKASLPPRGPKAASLTSTPNTDRVRQAQHLQQAAHAQQAGTAGSSGSGSSSAAGAAAAALASQELVVAPSAALQLACGLAPAAAAHGSPALPPQPNPRLQRHPMRRQRSSPAALDQVLDQMLQGMEGMCPANSSVIMAAIPQQAGSGHTTSQTPSHAPAPLLPPRPQDTLSAHYHHHYHCHQGHQLQYGTPSLFASAQPALRPAMSQPGSTPALAASYSVPAHPVGTGDSLPLGHGDPLAAAWLQPAILEHEVPQAVPLDSAAASQAGPQKHGEVPKCQPPEVAAAGTVAAQRTATAAAGLERAAPDSRSELGGSSARSPTVAGSAREKEEMWNRLLFNM